MYTRHKTKEAKNSIDSITANSLPVIIIVLYLLCLIFTAIATIKSWFEQFLYQNFTGSLQAKDKKRRPPKGSP